MKLMLAAVVLLATAATAQADNRVKWLADNGGNAHTQYVFAGNGVWVATDDNPGGYDVMVETARTRSYIVLTSTKYEGLTITLTDRAAIHRQPGSTELSIPGGWR